MSETQHIRPLILGTVSGNASPIWGTRSLAWGNRDFILHRIPHLSKLMVEDRDTWPSHGLVVGCGKGNPEGLV